MRLAPTLCSCTLLLAAGLLGPACFGDNAGGSPNQPGASAPEILEFVTPAEMDGDTPIKVKMRVAGLAGSEVAATFDVSTGTFSPPSQSRVADESSAATFEADYSAENTTATVKVTASAAYPGGTRTTAERDISVHRITKYGNTAPITGTVTETPGYLIAFPITVTSGGTLRRLGVIMPQPGQAAEAQIALYSNIVRVGTLDDYPNRAIAKTKSALAPGVNEILVEPQTLAAGKYWVVVTYSGTPTTARGPEGTMLVPGWSATGYPYAQTLPDVLPSTLTVTSVRQRNFYIAIRQ